MVMAVVHPRKSSITQKLFGGNSNHVVGHRKCSHEFEDDDFEECDDAMELVQIGAERTKNVLILMSDTGGGHRASAEAIRGAFQLEFGDEYRVISSIQMLSVFFNVTCSYYLSIKTGNSLLMQSSLFSSPLALLQKYSICQSFPVFFLIFLLFSGFLSEFPPPKVCSFSPFLA